MMKSIYDAMYIKNVL